MTKDHVMQNPAPLMSTLNLPSTAPWSLRAWPPLLWQAESPARAQFQHLSTRVEWADTAMGPPSGQTVWAMAADEGQAGMAWDWVQIASGVVAIADPMAVVTNLRLVGDQGEVLTAQQSALVLNKLVHRLPWQAEVQRALSARAS